MKINEGTQNYLKSNLSLLEKRTLAQLRLINKKNERIILTYRKFETHKYNRFCENWTKSDTILYILFKCQHYIKERETMKSPTSQNQAVDILQILENYNRRKPILCMENTLTHFEENCVY